MSKSLRLSVATNGSPEAELARALEAEEFFRWFGNTSEQLAREYGPYDDASVFLVVHDGSRRAVGMMRLIRPSGAGLKSLVDCAGEPWRLDVRVSVRRAGMSIETTWDVATLCVADHYRRSIGHSEVSKALYHGLYALSAAERVESLVTILDDQVLALLRELALPFAPLPGAAAQPYLGSPASTPAYAHLEAIVDQLKRLKPRLYQSLILGQGFRDVDFEPLNQHVRSHRRDVG